MEVKPGYKQTEVGVIPDEWNLDCIENLAHITTGCRNTQDRIGDGEYPFFVRSQTIESINSYSFDGEAVLTAGDGVGTGKVFHYINGKFDVHQRVYRISNFSERLNGFYFYLYFSTHFFNRVMQMTAKSSVDSVRREMIARMPVPLPPTIDEQRAIAEALSDVDRLLGGLDRLIAKKRDLKQAAMQHLLTGQTRLPGYSQSKEFVDTVIGRLPADWSVVEVKEATRNHKQGYYTKEGYVDHGVRLVRITDLMNPRLDYLSMPMLRLSASDHDLYVIRVGDFLFARSGAIGRYGIVYEDTDAIFGSYIIRFNFEARKLKNEFFGYLYETQIIWRQLLSITQGSSNININAANIKSLNIPLPHVNEQTAIAEVLMEMDMELAALQQRREKTRALKQAMMQQLLTGLIRLVKPERVEVNA